MPTAHWFTCIREKLTGAKVNPTSGQKFGEFGPFKTKALAVKQAHALHDTGSIGTGMKVTVEPRVGGVNLVSRVGGVGHAALGTKKNPRRTKKPSDLLRDMERPEVLGYELDRETLTPIRTYSVAPRAGDYGTDPVFDAAGEPTGRVKLVPSGRIVSVAEARELLKRKNPKAAGSVPRGASTLYDITSTTDIPLEGGQRYRLHTIGAARSAAQREANKRGHAVAIAKLRVKAGRLLHAEKYEVVAPKAPKGQYTHPAKKNSLERKPKVLAKFRHNDRVVSLAIPGLRGRIVGIDGRAGSDKLGMRPDWVFGEHIYQVNWDTSPGTAYEVAESTLTKEQKNPSRFKPRRRTATVAKRNGARKASAYTGFVKQLLPQFLAKGMKAKDAMRAVAKEWRALKAKK